MLRNLYIIFCFDAKGAHGQFLVLEMQPILKYFSAFLLLTEMHYQRTVIVSVFYQDKWTEFFQAVDLAPNFKHLI